MPYDLYGQYYASQRDAENAEMAQCAAIDADIASRNANKAMEEMQRAEQSLYERINFLEQRVAQLENKPIY